SVTPSGGISFRWFHYLAYPWGQPIATGPIYYYPQTGSWMCEVTTSNGVYTTGPVPIRTDQPYITAWYSGSSCDPSYVTFREEYTAVNGYNVYNSYQWKKDGNDISGASNYTYTPSSSGSYTCVVSLSCGTGTSNPIAVVLNSPIPSNTSITANGATTFCSGGSVTLSVPNTSGWTYQWKKNNTAQSGATSYSYSATQSGTYTCTITNVCGSMTTAGVVVTAETLPAAAITAGGATTFCTGSSVTLTANSGSYTYLWKNGGSAISGATSQNYVANAAGSYTCNIGNTCGASTSNAINVTVNAPPTAQNAAISAGGSTSFCTGGSVVLTVAASGLTYQWKSGGSTISGATLQSFTVSASGTYTCDVSNSCGTTTSNSITVTVNTAPTAQQSTITAGGPTTFCKGSSVTLSVATAGLTYQWKKGNNNLAGATQQSYTTTKTGTYKCVVSNSCGTITSNSISVTQNSLPTVSISQSPCSGGTILLTCTSNPNTGVTYQWKKGSTTLSGATNPTYNAAQNGTYKCTVTVSATGCTKTSAGSQVTITCRSGGVVNDNKVIIYPNPTADYFNISNAQLDAQSVIYIYDLTGRLVETYEVSGGEMKIGAKLSNGVYFLKVTENNEAQQVIKLVKNF
ncbi:MAG TPA: immunoglobulin domain-containing protein, partial [Chitinophagales bacterium]|nr:immunoglobulin domain-containing protein [Chitinophagales bacterium]